MEKQKLVINLVECPKCHFRWYCKSTRHYIKCSDCLYTFKNPNAEKSGSE